MEELREWIMQIAGVVILCAVCDIIIIDGGMKKYVKPVFGFVLIFTVMRPLTGGISAELDIGRAAPDVTELSVTLEGTEKNSVTKLYQLKLSQKISGKIKQQLGTDTEAAVLTSTSDESFGALESVKIKITSKHSEAADAEEIKKLISESFGLDRSDVEIIT